MRLLILLTLLITYLTFAHAWPPRYTWRRGHWNKRGLNTHAHTHAGVATSTSAMPKATAKLGASFLEREGDENERLRGGAEVEREKEARREAMERYLRRWRREI